MKFSMNSILLLNIIGNEYYQTTSIAFSYDKTDRQKSQFITMFLKKKKIKI